MAKRNIWANKRQGMFAKRAGDHFERWLSSACASKRWAVVKIPSGCEWVANGRAIPVKTPFDFMFVKDGHVIFGDAKTTIESTWSYSKVDRHQLYWLEYLEKHGAKSGYIVNFREHNQTVFFRAGLLAGLRPRCSLSPNNGILIGDNREIDLMKVICELSKSKETMGAAES